MREELRENFLGDKAQFQQRFAQQLAFALLFSERQAQLRLTQVPFVEQPITEPIRCLSLGHRVISNR